MRPTQKTRWQSFQSRSPRPPLTWPQPWLGLSRGYCEATALRRKWRHPRLAGLQRVAEVGKTLKRKGSLGESLRRRIPDPYQTIIHPVTAGLVTNTLFCLVFCFIRHGFLEMNLFTKMLLFCNFFRLRVCIYFFQYVFFNAPLLQRRRTDRLCSRKHSPKNELTTE